MNQGDLVIRAYWHPGQNREPPEVGLITNFEVVESRVHSFETVCPIRFTKYAVVLWPDNYDTHELEKELIDARDYYGMKDLTL